MLELDRTSVVRTTHSSTDVRRTDPAPVLFARAQAQPQAQRVAHAAEGERAGSAPTRQQAQQEER